MDFIWRRDWAVKIWSFGTLPFKSLIFSATATLVAIELLLIALTLTPEMDWILYRISHNVSTNKIIRTASACQPQEVTRLGASDISSTSTGLLQLSRGLLSCRWGLS